MTEQPLEPHPAVPADSKIPGMERPGEVSGWEQKGQMS